MTNYIRREEVLARDKMVFIGLDIHKRTWHGTAVVAGETVFRGDMPPYYKNLRDLFSRFPDSMIKVAYKAASIHQMSSRKPSPKREEDCPDT